MPKGVYDRSTSRWTPPPQACYPTELVARVRDLYTSGLTMSETAAATGVTVKVLQRLMPRHGIARRPAGKRDQEKQNNAAWRGDAAGYKALHLRVAAERGKPQACGRCGHAGEGRRYEWANLTGSYTDISDYERMCVPCHRKFDAARRRATGRPTSPLGGGPHV